MEPGSLKLKQKERAEGAPFEEERAEAQRRRPIGERTFARQLPRLRVCEKMQSAGEKWKQHVEAS